MAYQVAGTFEVGRYQDDSNLVLIPLAAAQRFFRLPMGDKPRGFRRGS